MIFQSGELGPVWKQFVEAYDALRQALAEVPDYRLHWRPGPLANTVAGIVQHIARANMTYVNMMEHAGLEPRWKLEEGPDRSRLLEWLDESEHRVRVAFQRTTPETLRQVRTDGWGALGPQVAGPLDARWFALQIVRHSAYHLGQINVYLLLWEGDREA